jgi:hypothetical protein
MSASQKRLELRIDVFEKTGQLAQALPGLTPPELVGAILQEFRELEYLSDLPGDYRLLKAEGNTPLDNASPLSEQLSSNRQLILVENQAPLPAGTQRPSKSAYLRDMAGGKVYRLSWQPAIIGRPDKKQPYNDRLVVNMETHSAGLRVSRRHAVITEENGQFYIQSLSGNPTFIKGANGVVRPVSEQKQPLQNGEMIWLEQSNINLKFIVR